MLALAIISRFQKDNVQKEDKNQEKKEDANLHVIPNVGRGDGYGQMSRAGLAL